MWGKWVQGQHANQAIKVKIANKKQRHNFFKRNPIKEEKSSGGLQGGDESTLPYSTTSSYPANLSQEGLYDAMAHAYPSLPSSLGSQNFLVFQYLKSLMDFLPGTGGCHTSSPDFYPSPTAYGQAYPAYPGYSYPANSNSIASK